MDAHYREDTPFLLSCFSHSIANLISNPPNSFTPSLHVALLSKTLEECTVNAVLGHPVKMPGMLLDGGQHEESLSLTFELSFHFATRTTLLALLPSSSTLGLHIILIASRQTHQATHRGWVDRHRGLVCRTSAAIHDDLAQLARRRLRR